MSWRFYLLMALALLVIMAFKLTKILAMVVTFSVLIVFIIAYFSSKGGKGDKT